MQVLGYKLSNFLIQGKSELHLPTMPAAQA